MKLIRNYKDISVYMLELPKDATERIAHDLARVEKNSYKVRFPYISDKAIDANYKLGAALNVKKVVNLLKKDDWYWLFAYQGKLMVGYGLFKITASDEVWVVELHTDLTAAPRKRVGTLLMHEGLKIAGKSVKNVILWVDKAFPEEHFPYAWYKRMGLRNTKGRIEKFTLGSTTLKKYPLRGRIDHIIVYCASKVGRQSLHNKE